MRRQRFVFLMCVLFALIAVVGLGCKNQFLEKPTFGSSNVANNEQSTGQTTGSVEGFGAPSGLKATQGGYREITLSWNPVQDAVRYYVYRANTQFETFVQVGETGDSSTSYTMKVQSGADFYYRVTAVNHAGEESRFSIIVRGTSLAQPLVSGVEGVEGKEDSDVTVYWYMSNVDAYQKEVRYNVICYDNKGTELARVVVDGSKVKETAAVISGLIPNTSYTYGVEAYIVSAQDKVEKCDPIDAATARRLRPNAPENLVVQQGQSKDGITLSFNLPALVDVALPGGVYEQKPLYFKIYRREYEAGSTDTEKGWVLLKADFGKTDTVPGENETQKVNFGNGDEEYTPGANVTWTDENKLNRGVKYEYKVQSFAYYERDLTSKYSASTQVGWLIAKAEFSTGHYETTLNAEETANESATLKFNFKWDTMGLDNSYHFLLAETRLSLEGDEDDSTSKEKETRFEKFTTIQAVNDYVRSFNGLDKKDARGYYQYKLTIFNVKNEELLVLDSLGRAIVTNEINLPVIELFSATSGYENKVELQWEHNPLYTYTISYSYESGTDSQTIDNETLYTKDGQRIQPVEGEIVTYTHTVDSGKKYKYKLSVKDKISVDSLPIIASTSKAPEVRKTNPSYDSITVAWEDVPASSFAISAKYTDSDVAARNIIEPQELEGNDSDNLSKVERTVTFSQPAGYNDATISGKPIAVTVVADIPVTRTVHKLDGDMGSSYDITTKKVETINLSTTTETATMGPALVGAKTSVGTYSDKITLSWNKVEGATAYVIYRNSLHISSKSSGNNLITEFEGTDKFIVTDVESETPSLTLDPAPTDTAFVAKYMSVARTDNKFTLTDMLCVEDLTDETLGRWHRAQSQISWGAPYEYIVLPLLTSTDKVEYDYEIGPAVATVDTVALTSVPHEAGATKGYAWNVKATKGTYSENGENTGVKLTWTRPWAMPTESYSIYRAELTDDDLIWEKLGLGADSNKVEFIDKNATPGKMYRYMVAPAVTDSSFEPHKNKEYVAFNSDIMDKGEQLASGFMLPQVQFSVTKD
ncbi:MAG: fibronectin type III domain-containing protein, partial [Spirochaetaceae bacterium]|nr:fibronectin type III domain-containing protein [Spirochaetaceae bacterium]